jgi:hypothetical protein
MNIFKNEATSEMVCATDQVVRSDMDHPEMSCLPGLKKAAQMDVQNTQRGAVRRKSGES